MAFTTNEVKAIYRKRARHYDVTANAYYLIGFREWACRKKAVAALQLPAGGTVVEIGCGTGLNFGLLQEAIGPEGHLIGVDLTDAMLAQARRRVERHGWKNVDLVQANAASYAFPSGLDGVISTFALTLMPEFASIIGRGTEALRSGGRWVVADLKRPGGWVGRLAPAIVPLARPFGTTLDLADRHPWEAMARHLGEVSIEEMMFGYVYIAVGQK